MIVNRAMISINNTYLNPPCFNVRVPSPTITFISTLDDHGRVFERLM